mgnify:CR=1 FL=1
MTYKQTEIKLEETPLQKWKKAYTWWKSNKPQDEESRKSRELAGDMVNELETQKKADKKAFEDLIDKRIKECERREMSCDAGMQYNAKLWRVEINSLKKLKEGLKSI